MPGKASSGSFTGCWNRADCRRPMSWSRRGAFMRFSLINPAWSFGGSIYFGCREPHLPLEYGYSKALLERAGHQVQIVDAQLDQLSPEVVRARVMEFRPDFTVVTTAP